MAKTFPSADLYALTVDRGQNFSFSGRSVTTTFLDHVAPLARTRSLQLPLMPLAWRFASRRRYDLVITSSHACAKGFRPGRTSLHLSYCHTPMRYAWLSSVDRRARTGYFRRLGEEYFRRWDRMSAHWVDEFAANSTCVRDRIQQFYGRQARIIAPPVDTEFFVPPLEAGSKGEFALAVSRMVGYKRLDLAIQACRHVGYPLVVAGAGPEEGRLRALAADLGADVKFVRSPDDGALRELYRGAQVLIFPGEEDFGIVPVEAQACGTPVVAYGRGGVLDTVVPGVTGVLVAEQDERSLAAGIEAVLENPPDPLRCRENAERFSADRFQHQFREWVTEAVHARGLDLGLG